MNTNTTIKNIKYKYFEAIYMLFLSISIGLVLTEGYVVAPIIFNSIEYITTPLDRLNEGALMSSIFLRGNPILELTGFYIFAYELFTLFIKKEKNRIDFLLSAISYALIIIFTMHQTPYIIESQKLGLEAINSDEFIKIHKNAELIFKMLFISLSFLFIRKVYKN